MLQQVSPKAVRAESAVGVNLNFLEEDEINFVKKLRTKFLKSSNYDRFTRPVHDQNQTLKIAFAMIFTQVLDLNLRREILSSDGIVHMVSDFLRGPCGRSKSL